MTEATTPKEDPRREDGVSTWGVWDRANLVWVGCTNKSESGARYDAARWNHAYNTIYYVAREAGTISRTYD